MKYIVYSAVGIVFVILLFSSIISYNSKSAVIVLESNLSDSNNEDIKNIFEGYVGDKGSYKLKDTKYIGHNIKFGYCVEQIFQKRKIKQLYKFRFLEKRKMLPLLIKGYKIKTLKSNLFNTDDIIFELEQTNDEIVYGSYIDERFCNFFGGL